MSIECLGQLTQKLKVEELAEDRVICKQGAPGFYVYILLKGQIDVYKDNTKVASKEPFCQVGEIALDGEITNVRTASLITSKPTTVILISKLDYRLFLQKTKYS